MLSNAQGQTNRQRQFPSMEGYRNEWCKVYLIHKPLNQGKRLPHTSPPLNTHSYILLLCNHTKELLYRYHLVVNHPPMEVLDLNIHLIQSKTIADS